LSSAEREQARTKFNQNENGNETIDAEHRVMETIFSNWDALGMTGGSIFVDGRMVAFTIRKRPNRLCLFKGSYDLIESHTPSDKIHSQDLVEEIIKGNFKK